MTPKAIHPLVQWAQREGCIYLTVDIDHVDKFDVSEDSVSIKGRCGTDETVREASLKLFGKVKTDYRKINTDRHLEVFIEKTEPSWWPRLLESKEKTPWVKIDFNKWVDEEDDVEGGGDGFDFNRYMGNYNESDMPDMGDIDSGSEEDYGEMPSLDSVEEGGAAKNSTNASESEIERDINEEKKKQHERHEQELTDRAVPN